MKSGDLPVSSNPVIPRLGDQLFIHHNAAEGSLDVDNFGVIHSTFKNTSFLSCKKMHEFDSKPFEKCQFLPKN